MRLFETRTLGYLHGLVGDDAEDVQQDVWLSVYRHVASWPIRARFVRGCFGRRVIARSTFSQAKT
jgi:DNA-directed RNA polymerase specialized sigma24 family protein